MTEHLKNRFEQGKNNKTTRRVDEFHPLDIFVGYNDDNNPIMVITDVGKVTNIESSRYIDVKIYKNTSGKVSICFNLMDKYMYSLFLRFCSDIIESTRNLKTKNVIDYIIRRWDSWRLMFKKNYTKLLNESQIKGLIGELVFLKNYMIPIFGYKASIDSWMGPNMLHKDFEINDTWYEVKTIVSSSLTVKINSVEQLESPYIGQLIVIKMDKTSCKSKGNITLNILINEVENLIGDFETRIKFLNKLNQVGYYFDEEYELYNYRVLKINKYLVRNDFPKITSDCLREGIVKASYEIALNSIEKYMIEGE